MLLNRYLFSAFPQKAEEVVSGARKAYSYMQREYGPQMTREQVVTAMLEGRTFQEVSSGSRMPVKRAMAYRLLRAVRTQGPVALQDRRQGHPSKLRGEVRIFLETSCRMAPHTPSSVIQTQLQERFDVHVSVSQINRVRKQLGVSNHAKNQKPGKKRQHSQGLPLKKSGRKEQEASCCWRLRSKRRPSRS
jgi:transposase